MGVGYSKQLTQFSRGQYSNATNTENDFLQIKGEGIGRYVEGTPNTDLASAETITLNSTGYGGAFRSIELVSDDGNTGIDYDYFKFTAPAAGSVNISVNNALIFSKDGTNFIGEDLPAGYGNLHLDAQILNASGGILADWNNNALVDVTGLTYSGLVAGQNYFVKVGPNSTLPDQSFGETTWGSLGAYALRIQADTNSTKSISIAKTTDGNEAGSVSSVFTLTRTGDLSSALTVNYTLAGTATPGVDYTGTTPGSLTFAAGSSKATIALPTKDDLLSDPGETIITTITAPVGYTISGPSTATATILDNDGNAANNNLVGTSFADALAGVGGNDTINGGLGNDTIDGGVGVDSMDGGDDNDTYFVDNVSDIVKEIYDDALGGTADTVFASVTYSLAPGTPGNQGYGIENLTLTGSGNINATGNSKNNILTGNSGSNVLGGGDGNDTLNGGAGNDSLTGGLGKDTLTGSTGLDTLNYNSLGESLLSGFDVIQGYSGTGTSLDRINAPAPIAPITLTASKGTAASLTEAAIQLVLTNAAFAANTAAAFTVSGQSGTFIALNNGVAGFQAASDAIIQLSGYNIAAATPVVVI
ncbi:MULTISPECIES: bluetail domain-containing putative surface protein [unclassified Microcystis]|nr:MULTISPECIES: bluetail domain-containing putative surface protein [unclassified Microcystis]